MTPIALTAPLADRPLAASLAGFVLSLAALLALLAFQGHAAFNTSSIGVMWGLPIVAYEFLASASFGLAFLALGALLWQPERYGGQARHLLLLAVAAMVGGIATLALELGHPLRMVWAVPLSLQTDSPMWWKGVLYPAYLALLAALLYRLYRGDRDSRLVRTLAVAGLAVALAAILAAGLVFGMMAMRPMWYDGLLPAAYLAGALLTGTALAMLVTGPQAGEGRGALLLGALLAVNLLFLAARTITGLWSNLDGLQAYSHLVSSSLFHLGLWGGLVLPLVLLILLPAPGMRSLAAGLAVAGQFIDHYEFVIGGQLVPLFKGSWVHGFVDYAPSPAEWMVALVGLFLAASLYRLGERLLWPPSP